MMHRKFQDRLNHVAVKTALVVLFGATSGMVQACSADTPYIGTVCYMAGNFCPEGYLTADGTLVSISTYQALYAIIGTTYGGDARTTFGLPDLRGRAVIGWGAATPQTTAVAFGAKRGAETVTLAANQVPLPQHIHQAVFTPVTGSTQVTIPGSPATPGTPPSLTTVQLQANPATTNNSYAPGNGSVLAGTPSGPSGAQIYATSAGNAPVNLGGLNVTLDPGKAGTPAIPEKTVSIATVTGGTVAIGAAGVAAAASVSLISPQQALTACIAVNGIFPTRP